MVPAAVQRLHELVANRDDSVLDVGTGGSTLFYARRCRQVVGLETKASWAAMVRDALHDHGLEHNSRVHTCLTQALLEEQVDRSSPVSVLSVDTVHGFNRDRLLLKGLAKLRPTGRRVVVLDNWAEPVLFPETAALTAAELLKHLKLPPTAAVEDYPDARWCGRGTRLIILLD